MLAANLVMEKYAWPRAALVTIYVSFNPVTKRLFYTTDDFDLQYSSWQNWSRPPHGASAGRGRSCDDRTVPTAVMAEVVVAQHIEFLQPMPVSGQD
jgi:hypothetical protein